jgi:predicted thioesterase
MGEAVLKVGLVCQAEQLVTPELSAKHIGSGSLRVYATPAMALLVERTCAAAVQPHLTSDQSTVGIEMHLRHLAPTPLGDRVRIRVELVEIQGNRLTFHAEIWDSQEKVGEAEHVRALIEVGRFLRRVEQKAARLASG